MFETVDNNKAGGGTGTPTEYPPQMPDKDIQNLVIVEQVVQQVR